MATHVWHTEQDHKDTDEADRCIVCRGGLAHCKVCGGAEGNLTTDCPGRRTTEGEREEIMAGVRDFKNGQWVVNYHWQDLLE